MKSHLTLSALMACFAAAAHGQELGTLIALKPSTDVNRPLAFDKAELSAKAGARIKLVLTNEGGALSQPYNVVLCKPGTADKVVAAAMSMVTDPSGMAKGYVPDSTDIVAYTPLAQPGETQSIEVTLPTAAGDYPFFSTFPGHPVIMKGVLKVSN